MSTTDQRNGRYSQARTLDGNYCEEESLQYTVRILRSLQCTVRILRSSHVHFKRESTGPMLTTGSINTYRISESDCDHRTDRAKI